MLQFGYIIVILLILIILSLIFSEIRIIIDDITLYSYNKEKNTNYTGKICLLLFGKIKVLSIKLEKNKIKKALEKGILNKKIFAKIEKKSTTKNKRNSKDTNQKKNNFEGSKDTNQKKKNIENSNNTSQKKNNMQTRNSTTNMNVKNTLKQITNKENTFNKILKNAKLKKLNMKLYIDTENPILTSYLIGIASIAVPNLIRNRIENFNSNDFKYKILPLYKNENYLYLNLNGIITLKLVHIINMFKR